VHFADNHIYQLSIIYSSFPPFQTDVKQGGGSSPLFRSYAQFCVPIKRQRYDKIFNSANFFFKKAKNIGKISEIAGVAMRKEKIGECCRQPQKTVQIWTNLALFQEGGQEARLFVF
jgi:hypothetical protein